MSTTIAIENPGRTGATDDTQLNASFARQPILNRDGMLCGYEIKVRAPAWPDAPADEPASNPNTQAEPDALPGRAPSPAQQVANAIVRGLVQGHVRGALTGHPAYVDVSRELLLDDAIERLPAERFMLELSPAIEVDEALIERIVQLHGRRYRFVLDEVTQPNESFARLLPYADVVKIDVTRAPAALLPKLASVLKSAGKLLIASGVDTQAGFEAALALGFDRFQGYFFARAQTSLTRRVSAPRHALLNLLQLLAGDPTVAQLEAELKLNPVLVMHLMKLANSSGLAVGHKVTTLREAINATGTDRIARWTQLLLYADGRKVALEDDPLLQLAATRARFMELAIERLPEAGRDEADAAFLTGVFSFVDAVFGGSLESTLNVLTLSRPIQAAILHREGVLGLLLSAVEALERGAWDDVEAMCARLQPLTVEEVAQLGLMAGAWAGVADRSAEGLERIED
ncbi:EAL and HDOD domain-containing protein [Paraburkholderia sp. 22099]|jgi:c-di-GMP-related signal transduction protein|uniref:C-di-GMP-related signal transduction protein, contains EAL and HDOD domains n=1 Tax=Paraburkholderia terricola TaxID=169427 RepID=A0A1M6RLB6_9BURK|nr:MULTISPECIES: EAL domain-containing protein [Paraburkholderia]MDR6493672.1 c-di-GMP-related signal transduction protein [Paraburkholderia terricola]SDO51065.1 c-di-GMP-related signal transduction protein, contains EAL and HDOD domains [Paraburkholderia sediminicola]SHK33242.1 c-di-GMP-related signal transduction protein, contains EAL and HDOD domains [Paraburkholderia terricola]